MLERDINTISIASFAGYLYGQAKGIAWPLTFTQKGERRFIDLLEAAVHRMESEGFGEDYAKFAAVEKTVEALVKDMRELATEADLQQIDDGILQRTLSKFCPVWPIC